MSGHPAALTLQALESGGWACGCILIQQQEQSCWLRFNLPPELKTDKQVALLVLAGQMVGGSHTARQAADVLGNAHACSAAACWWVTVSGGEPPVHRHTRNPEHRQGVLSEHGALQHFVIAAAGCRVLWCRAWVRQAGLRWQEQTHSSWLTRRL